MSQNTANHLRSVAALWRCPVKSTAGEKPNASALGHRRLLGDRAYTIVDPPTWKVARAKYPKSASAARHGARYHRPGMGRRTPASESIESAMTTQRELVVELNRALSLAGMRSAWVRFATPDGDRRTFHPPPGITQRGETSE
jgi:uncharacterized protein YcbX